LGFGWTAEGYAAKEMREAIIENNMVGNFISVCFFDATAKLAIFSPTAKRLFAHNADFY
jgi:hypothetical protein